MGVCTCACVCSRLCTCVDECVYVCVCVHECACLHAYCTLIETQAIHRGLLTIATFDYS